MIYFIQGAGLIKIGRALDPQARMIALQTGSPVPLTLLGYYEGDALTERKLHRRFESWWSHGEWFMPEALGLKEEIEKATTFMFERGLADIDNALEPFSNRYSQSFPTDR